MNPEQAPDKSFIRKALARRKKRILQSLKRLQMELEEARNWPKLETEAHLLQAHFGDLKRGMKAVTLPDWENPGSALAIPLNPEYTPSEEISTRFRKIKKYKKGIPHLDRMAAEAESGLQAVEECLLAVEQAETEEQLENIRQGAGIPEKQSRAALKQKPAPPKPYFEFFSEAGTAIRVGRNAKCNDLLTFHYANGLDTWLHAVGFSGSHVIIHTRKGETPDPETVKDALQLALHFSKAKSLDEAEVGMTLRKHVSRLGQSQPGKVQAAQQKIVKVRADAVRLARLLSSRLNAKAQRR